MFHTRGIFPKTSTVQTWVHDPLPALHKPVAALEADAALPTSSSRPFPFLGAGRGVPGEDAPTIDV